MKRVAITALGVIACCNFTAGTAAAQFLPRSFYDDKAHDIRQGEAFGVTIGMDRAAARKALEKHWNIRFSSTGDCGPPDPSYCEGAQVVDSYDVGGDILGGAIEVFLIKDRVVRMMWWRHPFDP